ncbi:MAG: pyruvate dehydrogenase complex dihydrolipoamide acetyltransferase [Bacteroidota bacterium]
MAEVITMPRMSDTMEEGNIVAWLKQEGDSVEPGDTLAEVETDKATMELDSYFEGVLLHIAIKEGPVPIDAPIAVIGEEGEDWQAALDAISGGGSANGSAVTEEAAPAPAEEATPALPTPAPAPEPQPTAVANDERIKASPLAKSMAKEAGLDLATMSGTGENGRIVKRDIEAAMAQNGHAASAPATMPQQVATPPAPTAPPQTAAEVQTQTAPKPQVPAFSFNGGQENYQDTPVSQMRKVIARRLSESKFGAPHFYLTVEIDMGKAWDLRKQLNEVAPVKISFNDLIVKAVAVNLRKHPAVNSSWMTDSIRTNGDVNIGVAVAVTDGLLVPVVRHADMKSLSQINVEVKEMAGRAKDKRLSPEEMSGNTFTISNLGMFGIEEFTAIINPPDACILAVGGIIEKPVVRRGEIIPGRIMKVTLSCDHRVVDGATGAQFLNDVKATLEEPVRLLV